MPDAPSGKRRGRHALPCITDVLTFLVAAALIAAAYRELGRGDTALPKEKAVLR